MDALAGVLAVEDARRFDGVLLRSAASHPEAIVRRHAALAMGRIGDRNATPTLLELLSDPDAVVQQDAAFALGLIRDPRALPVLRDLIWNTPPAEQTETHDEAITAIAKLGGSDAAHLIEDLLVRWLAEARSRGAPRGVVQALGAAWRLGAYAPVKLLAQYAESGMPRVRLRAIYSLSRLGAPAASGVLLSATEDADPQVRALAVRALTRAYADSADVDPATVAARVSRLVEDTDPGVRITALHSLATFEDPALAGAALSRVSDSHPNVRVQALAALGRLGGPEAPQVLSEVADGGLLAAREQALESLARVDRTAAIRKTAGWITSRDWRMRLAGARALGILGGDTALAWLENLVDDPDGRVASRALRALVAADSSRAARLAPGLLSHTDPVVRELAAQQVGRAPTRADVDLLIDAYGRSLIDPIPNARLAAIAALGKVAQLGSAERVALEDLLVRRYPTCEDYLVRRAAREHLPGVAAQWGAPTPITTGRDPGDYRDIVRRLLIPAEQGRSRLGLVIETDRGRITISLFAAEAPITVNALLELVDRNYFDGGAWHRVVPNFVIQDGDPRGDSEGGPGFTLRDEISRLRYARGTVGMALAGPDTGGSQFFITHGPQPHLDGTYPVIGQVESGMDVVDRITQGDRIHTIRRR